MNKETGTNPVNINISFNINGNTSAYPTQSVYAPYLADFGKDHRIKLRQTLNKVSPTTPEPFFTQRRAKEDIKESFLRKKRNFKSELYGGSCETKKKSCVLRKKSTPVSNKNFSAKKNKSKKISFKWQRKIKIQNLSSLKSMNDELLPSEGPEDEAANYFLTPIHISSQESVELNEMRADQVSQKQMKLLLNEEKEEKTNNADTAAIINQYVNSFKKLSLASSNKNQITENVCDLRQQQLQKWGYLLKFIKRSISNKNGSENDSREVLSQIQSYLDKNKFKVQGLDTFEIPQNASHKQNIACNVINKQQSLQTPHYELINHPSSQLKQSFTVPLAEREQNSREEIECGIEEQQLKILNLQVICTALQSRLQRLQSRRRSEISAMETKLEDGLLTQQSYVTQRMKVQKWFHEQSEQIIRAKSNIIKGFTTAKSIIAKDKHNKKWMNSSQKKMFRCLSEQYLHKIKQDSFVQKSNEAQSIASSSSKSSIASNKSQEQQKVSEGQSRLQVESMEAIRERLMRMKEAHYTGEAQESSYDDFEQSWEGEKQWRLKTLSQQERQDVFEFVFLDLTIQLYQEPCRDNVFMRAVSEHMARKQLLASRRKGIRLTLTTIKQYLKRLCNFVMRTSAEVLGELSVAMGPSAKQMLKYMHEHDYEADEEEPPALVLPLTLFDAFQTSFLPTVDFDQYYDDALKERHRVEFLRSILHIHNKALFDALNEFLDQQRPHGVLGMPFPWKKQVHVMKLFTQQEQQSKLRKSCEKVGEYCSFLCGLIADKEDSLVAQANLQHFQLEQIQEDRLSRMLAHDIIDSEPRWLFYDDEETEVLVEIASSLFDRLLIQFLKQI